MALAGTQTIGIDWSGAVEPRETTWLATVRDGRLCEPFANGRGREELIDLVADLSGDCRRTAVGLDFGFSLPALSLAERFSEVGRLVKREGEASIEGSVWRPEAITQGA